MLVSFANAFSYPTVKADDFKVGDYWVWAYSEKNVNQNAWKSPYLYEQYTVVKKENSQITFEMASGPQWPVKKDAHHRFVVDISKCLKNLQSIDKLKKWSVAFFSKSYSPNWELVSVTHDPLVFTEKFNCISESDKSYEEVVSISLGQLTSFKHNIAGWDSYYGSDQKQAPAVALLKYFDERYKFELVHLSQRRL